MTDGTTAIQVSPVVEDSEMTTIRNIFERVANTIVQATALAKQVAELSTKVAELQATVDHVYEQNRMLDEALASTRAQRDELQRQVNDLTHDLGEAFRSRDDAWATVNAQTQTINDLNHDLASTQAQAQADRERYHSDIDSVLTENHELAKALAEANAKLSAATAAAEHFRSILLPPTPAPEVAEPQPVAAVA